MNRDAYLEEHHHITESYLGLIRVNLVRSDHGRAMELLEECTHKLTELHTKRWRHLTKLMEGVKPA